MSAKDLPTPIPDADRLTIPWPAIRPLGIPVSAGGVKEAWDAIIAPLAGEGPQSVELRVLMAVVRSVYDGMHGILPDHTNGSTT